MSKERRDAYKELKQLYDRVVDYLVELKRKRAMESLIFLVEKGTRDIKVRAYTNGSMERAYTPKEKAPSPMAATESFF